jgi:hypothetical protein
MAPKMSSDDNLPMSAEDPPAEQPAEKTYPKKIQMTHLFAFFDEVGRRREWHAGDIITDPSEIKILVDHGTPVFVVLE